LTTKLDTLESCLRFLHSKFCHNRLALNSDKSETIVFGTSTRLHNFPPFTSVNTAGTPVPPSDKIVTLGVTLDNSLTINNHISNVCRSSHFHIRALHHIRQALTDDMAKTVAASLIHTRIDYANSLIHGSTNIKKLQRVQTSQQPATALLSQLHCLPVNSTLCFKKKFTPRTFMITV